MKQLSRSTIIYFAFIAFGLFFALTGSARPFLKVANAMLAAMPDEERKVREELEKIMDSYSRNLGRLHEFDPPEAWKELENSHWDKVSALLASSWPDVNKLNPGQLKVLKIYKGEIDIDDTSNAKIDEGSDMETAPNKCPCLPCCNLL